MFSSRAYLAALNALLVEHDLGLTELVPENPFAEQLRNGILRALRAGVRTRFDEAYWINMFNHEPRVVQLNVVAMALNELGQSPMLVGEYWRPVGNPFVIRDIDKKLEKAKKYIHRRHGEVVQLRHSGLSLQDWGLADLGR